MSGNREPSPSKDQIPALEEEVRTIKGKLKADYPNATALQLETAIGNALKASTQPLDQTSVEAMARKHLGSA